MAGWGDFEWLRRWGVLPKSKNSLSDWIGDSKAKVLERLLKDCVGPVASGVLNSLFQDANGAVIATVTDIAAAKTAVTAGINRALGAAPDVAAEVNAAIGGVFDNVQSIAAQDMTNIASSVITAVGKVFGAGDVKP